MGLYDRPYYRDESPRGFSLDGPRSMVTNLIIINVAVFLVDVLFLNNRLPELLGAFSDTLQKPWQWWRFITYGFCHASDDARHIIGNMIGLFFFGRDIEGVYGRRKFLGMYLTAILLGGVVWSLLSVATGSGGVLIGASGAVTAVIILFAVHYPRRTVYLMFVLPVPAWALGLLIILNDVVGVRSDTNVAHVVHLVGAAYAYAFYKTQWELGQYFSGDWFRNLRRFKPRPKLRVHNPESRQRSLDEQADAVLDKVHRNGEASLDEKERRILEEYSERMKQKHK